MAAAEKKKSRTVTFTATKTRRVPTTVRFKTKDGKTVKFKATTSKNVQEKVKFKAEK